MISKRRVPWIYRLNAPIHCKEPMIKIGYESHAVGGQVKVTWRCERCKHIEETLSMMDEEAVDIR